MIEGAESEVAPEIIEFVKSLGVSTVGNPDFIHLQFDSFKIEDARNLKAYAIQKNFSPSKRIFIVSANNFLIEAQNSLLKTFEEPVENTHFFLIVPDVNALLKTLVSRFYLISARSFLAEEIKNAEKFISLPLKSRIDFIKELLTEPEEGEDDLGVELPSRSSTPKINSARSKALKFLNALESVIHSKLVSKTVFDTQLFQHLFKVRKFLRMPGSSTKSLMESIALVIPEKVF